MSVCGEFAEHVWKPGSCKNCFHPRSAHANARANVSANTRARRSTCAEEEEDESASSPSPYSKPTIAVKPTMMNPGAAETPPDLNMNTQQGARGRPMGLKNILDVSPLYVEGSGCSTVLKETTVQNGVSPKLDYLSRVPLSPNGFIKPTPSLSTVFITQEESRNPNGLKENLNSAPYRPKSTYITSCDSPLHNHKHAGTVEVKVNGGPTETRSVTPSTPDSQVNASLSDLFLHPGSTDSLTGPETLHPEPIYAESAKRKTRRNAEAEVSDDSEGHRTMITVMAAHTEENNRTFYLSSPDSAVSTQWLRFSPTTPDDPARPAFSWPASPVAMENTPSAQPESRTSPPVPPKRTSRSPKLGTSSLSPLTLPELNFNVTPPSKLSQGDAHSSCPVLNSWSVERIEEEKNGGERERTDKYNSTPGTEHANNSGSQKQAGVKTGIITGKASTESTDSSSSEPRPPLPPPKKQHRSGVKLSVSSMDLDQRGSVESLPHSLKGINTTSLESLQALSNSGVQDSVQRSCPSLPMSPSCLHPPPLPEKKLLSRAASSDSESRLRNHAATSCSSPQLSSSCWSLAALVKGGASRECVYSRLGGLYGECVRRLALKCEERFTHTLKLTRRFFNENEWSLFKLSCSRAVCVSADAAYYPAACSSDTHTPYAVKICKGHAPEVKRAYLFGLSVQQSFPPHFNLQQDCGHFIACVPQSMLPGHQETPGAPSSPSSSVPLDQERVVVITRDVPSQSTAEFVIEYESFHRSNPEEYERRVCFLLLQLCNGLEHLKAHGVTHRDLCLENLLLVPQKRPASSDTTPHEPLPRLIISNFSKAKRRCESDDKHRAEFTRMAPEIVSASQYRKFDEFQTGILIYEMLHLPNPFEVVPSLRNWHYRLEDLPSIPSVSIYSSGLERLARLLLHPEPDERIHIADARRGLQSLLWGPRRELMDRVAAEDRRNKEPYTLLNWLDVKRALLMMKFAELSVELERGTELEDWLCCQYFSSTHPPTLLQTAHMMYPTKTTP
ncbi:inactive tyrosine-protein kinase PRAG1 [Trichomycterus rosablanca]|uniref:inactive tyrosine-protein kinase PRAG1 n=1 Tax=Trichomycterus rosablanca TaxID=2290929 RepID=UPI002F355E2E